MVPALLRILLCLDNMQYTTSELLKFILIPLLAPAGGALIARFKEPSKRSQSITQHFAAGLVFAAAATELLPVLLQGKKAVPTTIGFALGIFLLMWVKKIFGGHYHGDKDERADHSHGEKAEGSLSSMVSAISIDVAVDGLLVGLGFAVGRHEGIILLLAMSVEVLFLGISTMSVCSNRSINHNKALMLASSSGVILGVAAIVGNKIASALHGDVYLGIIAFGLAALLYLVTEELLIEAHESPDEPVETASFFVGFLAILLLTL